MKVKKVKSFQDVPKRYNNLSVFDNLNVNKIIRKFDGKLTLMKTFQTTCCFMLFRSALSFWPPNKSEDGKKLHLETLDFAMKCVEPNFKLRGFRIKTTASTNKISAF